MDGRPAIAFAGVAAIAAVVIWAIRRKTSTLATAAIPPSIDVNLIPQSSRVNSLISEFAPTVLGAYPKAATSEQSPTGAFTPTIYYPMENSPSGSYGNSTGVPAPNIGNYPTYIRAVADAIAFAEGYYSTGSRPQRNANPGDLTIDLKGGGRSIGMDGVYVKYATQYDGWLDLYEQVRLMYVGPPSSHFNSTMTIKQVAALYTATEQTYWANNVAKRLGVTVDTTLLQIAEKFGV